MSQVCKTEQSLSKSEQSNLLKYEEVISRNLKVFSEVGTALLAIRDGRLCRETHGTFEAYCREKLGMSRPRAYQLIDAAQIVENVSTVVDNPEVALPLTERQARPLARLEPEHRREVWKEAVETAPDGKVTVVHVEAAVKRRLAGCQSGDNGAPSRSPSDRNQGCKHLPPMPEIFSAAELRHMEFEEPTFVIPGLVPTGLILLVGRPKIGKSYLLLDIALALSTGGYAIGQIHVEQTGVLYISLEDRKQRLKKRIDELFPRDEWPNNFFMAITWARTDKGGMDQLRQYIEDHPSVKVVIIDTLAKIRSTKKANGSVYDEDYREIGAIKTLADSFGVSVIVCHHVRKMDGEDPLDAVSGTTGIAGSADTILVLKRDIGTGGATLYIRGRDIEEKELALQHDPSGGWRLIGDAQVYRRSKEQLAVLGVLKETGVSMTPAEIATSLKKTPNAVQQLLPKLVGDKIVIKDTFGRYSIPITHSAYTTPSGQSGNSTHTAKSGQTAHTAHTTQTERCNATLSAVPFDRTELDPHGESVCGNSVHSDRYERLCDKAPLPLVFEEDAGCEREVFEI